MALPLLLVKDMRPIWWVPWASGFAGGCIVAAAVESVESAVGIRNKLDPL
jgi:hypothetical protein